MPEPKTCTCCKYTDMIGHRRVTGSSVHRREKQIHSTLEPCVVIIDDEPFVLSSEQAIAHE